MSTLWKAGRIVSLKLEANLYSLAQMRGKRQLICFDVFRPTDAWKGIDLNAEKMLFCIQVADNVLHFLGARRLPPKAVKPYEGACPRHWIRPMLVYYKPGVAGHSSGSLIDLGDSGEGSTCEAPVLIEQLDAREHRPIILEHELCNLRWGPEQIRRRLLSLHRHGKYYDWQKHLLFPKLYDFPPMTPGEVFTKQLEEGEPPPGWFDKAD